MFFDYMYIFVYLCIVTVVATYMNKRSHEITFQRHGSQKLTIINLPFSTIVAKGYLRIRRWFIVYTQTEIIIGCLYILRSFAKTVAYKHQL